MVHKRECLSRYHWAALDVFIRGRYWVSLYIFRNATGEGKGVLRCQIWAWLQSLKKELPRKWETENSRKSFSLKLDWSHGRLLSEQTLLSNIGIMLHIRSPETFKGDRYIYHLDMKVISLVYACDQTHQIKDVQILYNSYISLKL